MNQDSHNPLPDFDAVLFGGTGDLALRKLLPAFYHLEVAGLVPANARILALGRETSAQAYLIRAEQAARKYIEGKIDENHFQKFFARVHFQYADIAEPRCYEELAKWLSPRAAAQRIFYFATGSDLFAPICQGLAQHGLHQGARVVLEKPIGSDFESAEKINSQVGEFFQEEQIFRIDHYLGKEAVQNLLALRFGNTLFETLWRRQWVSHVQITVGEKVGVERRAQYYDHSGAMRDMVQNHLLQLLCIVAMEPPVTINADDVRDEKVKVLQALKPLTGELAMSEVVRGQYKAGVLEGEKVKGYLQEEGVPANSKTETFVAMRVEVNNWRWAGVPFYLRTGKRLQERMAEIVIHFREVPHLIFPKPARLSPANRLVIQLQPDESVQLHLLAKSPGDRVDLRPVALDLNFAQTFEMRSADAYERLLADVVRGRLTLFVRRDEVQAAWRWIEPIQDAWQRSGESPRLYTAGGWGPSASSGLLSRNGHCWHEEL